ncbi:uncharacterized protein [Fopius arisanus]|uniref:Uncharacterized protein n=1 Tax=Fopius arisanus TaxID=64838 RepID=A0A9R1TRD5_9HYME|nr:PREDICTED: uncharacterized protein LOC105273109 [Fopius arisanus]
MSNYVGSRIDRSFLYLMAIYVIHGILLHVFLRPINVNGDNIDKDFFAPSISNDWIKFVDNVNTSYVNIEANDNSQEGKNSNDLNIPIINHPTYQMNPGRGKMQLLSPQKCSSKCFFPTTTLASVVAAMKNISPATWGIISGCIVFLLTFTENDHVR